MPATTRKSRGWCFTLNNYVDDDIQHLANVECQYLVYGKERGSGRGTEHLQGYIHFGSEKTLRGCKLLLGPRYHLEPRLGTISQAVDYCKKDGDFTERGRVQGRATTTTKDAIWSDLIRLAEAGKMQEVKEAYPRHFIQYNKTLMSIRAYKSTPLQGELKHEWWYGPTGTGKSKKLWDTYPEHYAKPLNKWWDGYQGQAVVAIEEWEPKNECTASKLKIWADRYPFPAEIKGGNLERVRPEMIIVTSNYTIEQCFPRPEDYLPLKRRFKEVLFPFAVLTRTPPPSVVDLTQGPEINLVEQHVDVDLSLHDVDFDNEDEVQELLQL